MEKIEFKVQGSAPEPYDVVFIKHSSTNLSAYCTCPAGENGQYCKHRLAILEGLDVGIVSPNVNAAKIVHSWLPGTDIEKIMLRMRALEKEADRIKLELSSAKKDLARALRN